jgi:hypothetical protein
MPAVDAPASVRPVGTPGSRRAASVTPLNADEQAAFDWATQHPFWRLRITNWVNLRNNFQDGRAFRMQFLDAQNMNALAGASNTDQGNGYNSMQTPFGGLYHGQNQRAYQSAPPKLCPAERARLAEQRLFDRLERERAERARVING